MITTKETTTKIIINFNKDPFTTDNAEQVIYAIKGLTGIERKQYNSRTGFEELYGKVLTGVLMNEKGQLVLYLEENTQEQNIEALKNLVNDVKKIDEEPMKQPEEPFNRYRMPSEKPIIQPLIVEPKEVLMEKYKGRYSEQDIDSMINKANIINAVDKFMG